MWLFTRPMGWAMTLVALVALRINVASFQGDRLHWSATLVLASGILVLALLAVLWLHDFDEPHDYEDWRRERWALYAIQAAIATIWVIELRRGGVVLLILLLLVFGALTWSGATRSVRKPGHRKPGEPARQAWLVVTLDLTQDPPVAIRANIFSCNAQSLTSITRKELNLDVAFGLGDSYEEARRYILDKVPTWYPYLVPLLRKSGERVGDPS